MAMIVRAFPVLPGKEDAALKFAQAVGDSRRHDTASFLQSFGVRRETWHLQRTPHGAFVIVVTDVEDPPLTRAQAYGAAQGAYERWFKDNIRDLCGIDADTQPLGPPTETIFSWDSPSNQRKTFDAPQAA
ncbi:MAG TPA: hypothetical protein VGP15_18135 [Burkholderiales bacterium]|jgi:hypothetical protein|nr:hypothetical protein [Burkholderiales bacterium]